MLPEQTKGDACPSVLSPPGQVCLFAMLQAPELGTLLCDHTGLHFLFTFSGDQTCELLASSYVSAIVVTVPRTDFTYE